MAHEMRQPTAALGELVKLIIKPNFANLVKIVNALAGDSLDKDGRRWRRIKLLRCASTLTTAVR